jgi:isopenicillin-N epimerase
VSSVASPADLAGLADLFLIPKDITFLNHGSFGACPRVVFETYQAWQREIENQPVQFLGRRLKGLLADARTALADFLGAQPDDVVYVTNITFGANIVARSIELQTGDEVLSTNLEYGAIDRTWRYYCDKRGARLINHPMTLPITTAEAFVEEFWAGVTPRTKVISISHITSGTALILPIAEIVRRAREAGILTFIDGAHAPGQIDLRLDELGADFYSGNCHKWLCSPKGAGFLHARRDRQALLEPFVISWGYKSDHPSHSLFLDHNEWLGTDDPSAYLSVPTAIQFQREHDWPRVRAECHSLARQARERIAALSGRPQIAPDSTEWWQQMCTAPLPPIDAHQVKERLWDEFKVEIPVMSGAPGDRVRVSIQAYNSQKDVDRLVEGLTAILGES